MSDDREVVVSVEEIGTMSGTRVYVGACEGRRVVVAPDRATDVLVSAQATAGLPVECVVPAWRIVREAA